MSSLGETPAAGFTPTGLPWRLAPVRGSVAGCVCVLKWKPQGWRWGGLLCNGGNCLRNGEGMRREEEEEKE